MPNPTPPTTLTIRVTDLGCAAYLYAEGHPVLSVEKMPSGICVFDFPLEASTHHYGYFQGAQVVAMKMSDALKQLKRRIHLVNNPNPTSHEAPNHAHRIR